VRSAGERTDSLRDKLIASGFSRALGWQRWHAPVCGNDA
jgi:hypothetical protein